MNKSIIELIASDQAATAVTVVEKVLAKKLLKAISEQARGVARNTYGTVHEAFGADEQPEFVNPSDNTYAVFFANALKKFGVNGPQDFQDEATKQQFFQYVDNNWKAQDSVQGIASQAAPGPTMDQGTGTQLPATATQPRAPQAPMQTPFDTTMPSQAMAQSDGPALNAMSPTGNAGDSALTPGTGDDPGLDNAQNAQQMGGTTCQSCGQPMPEPQTCQCCGQPMPTAGGVPGGNMPGQPGPGQQVQPGADMGDDDSDPDLEIGDEDVADDDDQFGQDPDDEQNGGFGDGDDDGGFGNDDDEVETDEDGNPVEDEDGDDEAGDEFQNTDIDGEGNEVPADDDDEDDEDDDPLSDPYSVSPDDFADGNDDDDQDQGDDQFNGGGSEDPDQDQDPDLEVSGDDDEEDDDDEDDQDDDSDEDSDGDDPYDEEADDDEDSDDDGDDDDDDEVVVAPKKKSKNPFAANEDFGYKAVAEDNQKFIVEFLNPMIKQTAKTDPAMNKKLKMAKQHLGQFKVHCRRNVSAAKKQVAMIMKDPSLSPEQKEAQRKHVSDTTKADIKHHSKMAKRTKAAYTGKISSGASSFDHKHKDKEKF